jgi:RsiW-degrading membrane proteinase PrsW (M82 family)
MGKSCLIFFAFERMPIVSAFGLGQFPTDRHCFGSQKPFTLSTFEGPMISVVLLVLSVIAATVPMAAFLAIVWWLDRYDREPAWLVITVFLWGALFATLGSLVLNSVGGALLVDQLGRYNGQMLGTMFIAPLVEEPMKASILLVVALTRWFDNTTDGFVYGAAVGLGFAMTENFLYFSSTVDNPGQWVQVVIIRTACSGVMHALASSIVGASLGWAKCRTLDLKIVSFIMGLTTAMTVHMIWNTFAVLDRIGSFEALTIDLAIFAVEFIMVFSLFLLCLQGEHRMIKRELMIEAKGGVLPPQHVAIIASVNRRSRRGWCPEGVQQAAYIETATKLAFRRMQCRGRGGRQRKYVQEARALRHKLRAMLGTKPLPLAPGETLP